MVKRFRHSILLTIILMGIVGLLSGCSNTAEEADVEVEEDYTPVEVASASVDTIANEITLNGKVVANEEIMVIPKAVGIVTSVDVELGDVVEEGTTLFTIEKDDISKGVEQAANAVELAKKSVAQAENNINTAKLNFELNVEKIENAQLNLERTKKLFEEGAVSKSQLEQAELAASDKNIDVLEVQLNQAEISYEQALNQLRQAEISYEQASSGLDNTVVTAPISGIVSTLNVKQGQIVTNSQAAATIVDKDKVYIQLNVVENMVNRLEVGQEVEVNVSAAFDNYVSSTISYISPTADVRSQLYPVRVYLDNVDNNIRPGMNGKVKLNMDQVDSAIVVKSNAVLDRDGKKIVYVVDGDVAVEKEVTVGLDTGEYIEIKTGISEGEKVIVEGQHYVKNDGKVKVVRGE
ncbi:efflux RND transporter periplasmic adaptor subunit [Tissierella sp. Yu-01]|uniref:efflux RND transporter periplasmic adaptor subunit n=1 Tax=Tissierella sp. Yu-01 TaxID=3035694 RepID=UPI00240DC692|nr:efflux RND transporter periplasmic adaptor subunit [Tissierella sp. Yu-01]WFA08548.1 efflux RND transporter periplasmic adaptor subunit [Tissierella sp. Yu-01]